MWSKDKIDLTADMLKSKKIELQKIKTEILEMELKIQTEFEELSSTTNRATTMKSGRNVIKRGLSRSIRPDDLRVAIGEWVEPEELDSCIVPERQEIVIKPSRVDMNAVKKLKNEGGMLADQIEKCTSVKTSKISVEENK